MGRGPDPFDLDAEFTLDGVRQGQDQGLDQSPVEGRQGGVEGVVGGAGCTGGTGCAGQCLEFGADGRDPFLGAAPVIHQSLHGRRPWGRLGRCRCQCGDGGARLGDEGVGPWDTPILQCVWSWLGQHFQRPLQGVRGRLGRHRGRAAVPFPEGRQLVLQPEDLGPSFGQGGLFGQKGRGAE